MATRDTLMGMTYKEQLVDIILSKAGKKYQELKMDKNPYTPPELIPDTLPSDQIKALAIVMVDVFMREFK
jgi:hypothetical protein